MKKLGHKRVVITGGAGGIGRATVARFLYEGSRVIALDCDQGALDQLANDIPGIYDLIEADVSDMDSVKKAFERIDYMVGGIDVLINNAGISLRHRFLEITPEEWQRVMDINLKGVFYCAQEAARRMIESERGGVIVNMGSTNGIMGYPFYADYNASKAGVIELTRSMALEVAPLVRVNAVCPGFILTPMQKAEYTQEMQDEFAAKLPLKRLGNPEDVAALFAFLASEESAFITGQAFVIDGGEIAGGLGSR